MNSSRLLLALRVLLLVVGLSVLYLLIDHAGPDEVLRVLIAAAPWLPLLIALEAAWVSWDALLIRRLYGDVGRRVPWWAHVRSAILAYPFLALLPAGRAGAEAARATALARWVSGPRAAAAAAQAQGCGLLGNGIWSIPLVVTCALLFSATDLLTLGVAANMLVGLVVGAYLLRVLKRWRLGRKVGRFSSKLAAGGEAFDEHLRETKSFVVPVIFSVCGRATQFLQYMFAVAAIGGVIALDAGALAQGVHLIGALLGDFVPNQVGVADGMFVLFADSIYGYFGFASASAALAAILSIELLRRIAQLFWSLVGATVPFVWRVPDEDWHRLEAEVIRAEQATEEPAATYAAIASTDEAAMELEAAASASASDFGHRAQRSPD